MSKIKNVVVVSDTHIGCRLGLCCPDGAKLDDGGTYKPSRVQLKVWRYWREFWDEWVPRCTHGEPYHVVLNGDAIDHVHHASVTQISQNIEDQVNLALKILAPVVDRCAGYYHIRGTEAHGGKSSQDEERLAKELNAIPNKEGQHARYELYARVGKGLCHFAHHIGTTGSSNYESTAVFKGMVESWVESGRWGHEPPDIIVRSHRHRQFETRVVGQHGYATALVTPGWQLKTPFVYRTGAILSTPQFGGSLIRVGDEETHTRHFVRDIQRPPVEGER